MELTPTKNFKNKEMLSAQTYSFTLNPSDKHQYWNEKLRRFEKVVTNIKKLLGFILYAEYELYPEISIKGRVHFHGYLSVLDPVNFLLYDVKKLETCSIYEIDTIANPEVWRSYIQKDKKKMKSYCSFKNYPYQLSNKSREAPLQNIDIIDALNHGIMPVP